MSPDEALVKTERFSALSEDDQEKLVPLAPDIAVELVSNSQEYGKKREDVVVKCGAMFDNGVKHVVMLDPYATSALDRVQSWGSAPPHFPTGWDDVLDA